MLRRQPSLWKTTCPTAFVPSTVHCPVVQSDSEPDEKDGLVHLEEDLINFRSECEDALLATCQVLGPQQYIQQVKLLSLKLCNGVPLS